MESHSTAGDHLTTLVNDLERLAQWLGREEPRRGQMRRALAALRRNLNDPIQAGRALLGCAVTADRMYSSCVKRRIRAKLRECYGLLSAAKSATDCRQPR